MQVFRHSVWLACWRERGAPQDIEGYQLHNVVVKTKEIGVIAATPEDSLSLFSGSGKAFSWGIHTGHCQTTACFR